MHDSERLLHGPVDGNGRRYPSVTDLGDLQTIEVVEGSLVVIGFVMKVRHQVGRYPGRPGYALCVSPEQKIPAEQVSALRLVAGGRSYADVAEALSLDRADVVDLVHAASEALTAGDGANLTSGERVRVIDWLVGQSQTEVLVEQSPAARAYAATASSTLAAELDVQLRTLPDLAEPQVPARPTKTFEPPAHGASVHSSGPAGASSQLGSSRKGGLALLATAAAGITLAALYLFGAFDGSNSTTRPTSTSSETATAPNGDGSSTKSPNLNGLAGWKLENRFYLSPVAGGKGAGLAGLESKDGQRALLAAGTRMVPSGIVGIWLTGGPKPLLIGFQRVSAKGEFSAIGAVPKGASQADRLIVTSEQLSQSRPVPSSPGRVLLTSPFKLG